MAPRAVAGKTLRRERSGGARPPVGSFPPVDPDGPKPYLGDRGRAALVAELDDPGRHGADPLEREPGQGGDLPLAAKLFKAVEDLVEVRVGDPELVLVGLSFPQPRRRGSFPDGRG